MDVTKAWDGEECLEKVFAHEPLYYSIIVVSDTLLQFLHILFLQVVLVFYHLLTTNL